MKTTWRASCDHRCAAEGSWGNWWGIGNAGDRAAATIHATGSLFFVVLTMFSLSVGLNSPRCSAQKLDGFVPSPPSSSASVWEPATSPPPGIAELLDAADVTFQIGPDDDPRAIDSTTPMAAETFYKINVGYRWRSNWRVRGSRIRITVQDVKVDWRPEHVVWFRDLPNEFPTDGGSVWENRLLLHELDHVKISNHDSLQKLFQQKVQSLTRISGDRELGESDSSAANRLVQSELSRLFGEVTDLIRIRYVELDRVTEHGLRALPSGWTADNDLQPTGLED